MIEMTKSFCYEQSFAWRVLFALYSGLYTYIKLWTHPHNIRVESDCWNFQQIIETTKQAVMIKDVQWTLAVLITGLYTYKIMIKNEPAHDKPTKWHVRPAKTQISLVIRPVWSESLLSAWRKLGSLATNWAHSELWSDWADAQADQSLHWAHMPFRAWPSAQSDQNLRCPHEESLGL